MKKNYSKLKDKGKYYFLLNLFLIALMGSQTSWGKDIQKQVKGSYPVMDDGFEGQAIEVVATSVNPSLTKWTNSGSVTANIVNTAGKARSGNNCVEYSIVSGGRYVQSPQIVPTLTSSTDYIVQFYFKSSTNSGVALNAALNSDAKRVAIVTLSPAFVADKWSKASIVNAVRREQLNHYSKINAPRKLETLEFC